MPTQVPRDFLPNPVHQQMHGDVYDATNDKNGSIDEEDVIMGCDNDETNEVDRADDDDDDMT